MAYTRSWDETKPNGATVQANTLDTEIHHVRIDLRERIADIFGMAAADFNADPVVPRKLALTHGAITTDINTVSATVTWNDGAVTFTAIELNVTNTASAAASKLIDLQVGGVTQFNVTRAGAMTITGAIALTGVTFTTSVLSTTALATPGALSATQFTAFASTASGAALMGYGTTNDVTLMNRAGTVVLGITANTTTVTMAGALAITGALSGITTLAVSNSIQITGTAAGPGQAAFNYDATNGLQIRGKVGASFDFMVLRASDGVSVFHIPTGTRDVFFAGTISSTALATTANISNAVAGTSTITTQSSVNGALVELIGIGKNSAGVARQFNLSLNRFADDVFSISDGTTERWRLNLTNGAITTSSTINSQTISATANFTGTATFASTITVSANGIAVTGNSTITGTLGGITTLTATTLAGTLSTAAQPNVTSLGTLTSLTTSGTVTMTAAVSKIVPGATSWGVRNNADNADNIIITDAGAVTFRNTVTAVAITASGVLTVNNNAIVAQGAITAATSAFKVTSTWNEGTTIFTGLEVDITNTASSTASHVARFMVGGVTVFRVPRTGNAQFGASAAGINVQLFQAANLVFGNSADNSNVTLANTGASGLNELNCSSHFLVSGILRLSQTTLLETTVALGNGAAAATGTLTNAPSAGNPTKWVSINDNGTTRYFPTWT